MWNITWRYSKDNLKLRVPTTALHERSEPSMYCLSAASPLEHSGHGVHHDPAMQHNATKQLCVSFCIGNKKIQILLCYCKILLNVNIIASAYAATQSEDGQLLWSIIRSNLTAPNQTSLDMHNRWTETYNTYTLYKVKSQLKKRLTFTTVPTSPSATSS